MDSSGNESYGSLSDEGKTIDKHKRELGRLRSSPSFRLSMLFARAARRPWRLLWLPISILILFISVFRERTGHKPRFSDVEPFSGEEQHRNSIVMFPTNGVGFGHFTRMLAVARRMKTQDPELEIVFFTTMPTLHILQEEGFPAYHLPNRKKFSNMEPSTWNAISEDLLANIFAIHRPKAFIFDGAYPYRGMLNAIKRRNDIFRIWMRRRTVTKKGTSMPVDSFSHFDMLIRPQDSVESENIDDSKMPLTIDCNPVILLDESELLPSSILRNRLGIPMDATVAYVQLGAGRINIIDTEISITLEVLAEFGVWAVIGESLLGSRMKLDGKRNIRILRDYPNSQYFNSFDFAVIAGGYNSYHEAVSFSLPSICIPNIKTGMDDQMERAKVAANAGCMIVIDDISKQKMKKAISKLLDERIRKEMMESAKGLHRPNGASEIAERILETIETISR